MGIGSCTSKTVLSVLGILFFLAAMLMWGVSGYVIATFNSHYTEFLGSKMVLVPAVVGVAVGIVFFLVGLLGCCGSDNRCTLTLFGAFLVVLLGLLLTGIGFGASSPHKISDFFENKAVAKVAKYDAYGNSSVAKDINYFQTTLDCCGMKSLDDYNNATAWITAHPHMVPASCSSNKNATGPIPMNDPDLIWSTGCVSKMEDQVEANSKYILGALIGFGILLVLGIVSSCILCCIKRQETVPYFSLH